MASRPWDERPLPPLPPEAYTDSAPPVSKPVPPLPTPRTASQRTTASPAIHPGDRSSPAVQSPAYFEPSSDDDDSIRPNPRRPAHSRSMSNPFPSFFSAKKKKDKTQPPISGSPLPSPSYYDETDRQAMHSQSSALPNSSDRRRKPVQGPNDLKTGHCMTCASLVRWPKDLQTFRCTICMTINDTEPTASRKGSTAGSQQNSESLPLRAGVISLTYTKSLVKECLLSSLKASSSPCEDSPKLPKGDWPRPLALRQASAASSAASTGPASVSDSPSAMSMPRIRRRPSNLDLGSTVGGRAFTAPLSAPFESQRTYSTSYPGDNKLDSPRPRTGTSDDSSSAIFKRLEDYLITCFKSYSCLNNSFLTTGKTPTSRPEPRQASAPKAHHIRTASTNTPDLTELDAKLLMLGDFAENGFWWTGGEDSSKLQPLEAGRGHSRTKSKTTRSDAPSHIKAKTPCIDWVQMMEWYHAIIKAPSHWLGIYNELVASQPHYKMSAAAQHKYETRLFAAHHRLQRVFLKCIENLLKRPGTQIAEPRYVRFLLILLCNPLLTTSAASQWDRRPSATKNWHGDLVAAESDKDQSSSGRHSGIIKRILGLLANSSEDCHRHLTVWMSDMPEKLYIQAKDLTSSFVTYRLTRQNEKIVDARVNVIDGLVPQMSESSSRGSNTANLHTALSGSNSQKRQKQPTESKQAAYTDDWQIKAAARVMALIFAANDGSMRAESSSKSRPLPVSDFYHSLVDTLDFKSDFELWESKRAKFTFCQYPFFLSVWAKIQILEHDAKRQMTGLAREAFFDSILSHRAYAQHLVLKIRRDCLVDDSLKKVSEVVGSGSEDIKKALRIEFTGEEGVDAGGLRKEWFLLLVREVFNPEHGLFVYDEDSQLCYFNPHSFETSDQYFLVGVVLGLAIYNSTILDIALPPFAFRKLLAAGPPSGNGAHPKPTMNYTLDDLAELRPGLARGLRQLLEYKGDVQADLCLDFVAEVERYGTRQCVPLCPGGETKMVTASNRREYVDLFVRYHLDTAVTRQFEPFKRGFFTVCGGNALSLFRPEEIELLVRGSDEALDIMLLKGSADYSQWPKGSNAETDPTVQWFWESFGAASPADQRRLLAFITGSDRIPATGAAALTIRIHCLGEDEGRFPSARTCFNQISLYKCKTRKRLEETLWRAVYESEGFGLK